MSSIDKTKWNLKEISENKQFQTIKKNLVVAKIDMSDDTLIKCQEKIQNAADKFLTEGADSTNFEAAANMIKTELEKENGPTWICIVGNAFAFNVNFQHDSFLHCYCGDFAFLIYKC